MPNVYLKDDLYKRIILLGEETGEFVEAAVEDALQRKEKVKA